MVNGGAILCTFVTKFNSLHALHARMQCAKHSNILTEENNDDFVLHNVGNEG